MSPQASEVFTVAERRQTFPEEFRRETVRYVQSQTKTVREIAEELNIPVGTVRKWLQKYRSFEDEPIASKEKLQAAEKRIKDLEEEVAILKKAVHFFSKDQV